MSPLTAEQRGDLAEAMLPVATNLVMIVHGEGGPNEVADLIGALDDQERTALLVVLAGLVDPYAPLPKSMPWGGDVDTALLTPREIAEAMLPTPEHLDDEEIIDPVAIEDFLNGRHSQITDRERLAAIVEGRRRGLTYLDIDHRAGAKPNTASKFMSRMRGHARTLGVTFPFDDEETRFTEADVIAIRKRSAAGRTDLELAMSLGVTRKAVNDIVNGVTYRDFGGPVRKSAAVGSANHNSKTLFAGGKHDLAA